MAHARTRTHARRTDTVSRPATLALARLAEAARKTSFLNHAKRLTRVALTFKPCGKGVEDLPNRALELNKLRMFVLTQRFTADRGDNLQRTSPLAIYSVIADLPGTGRLRFVPDAVLDVAARPNGRGNSLDPGENATATRAAVLMSQAVEDAESRDFVPLPALPVFYYAFHANRSPVFEERFTREEWAAAEIRIGTMRAWPAAMFARLRRERYAMHPLDGSPCPDFEPDGVYQHDDWYYREGAWYPGAQLPDSIYTYLAPVFNGRQVRNPAYAVLRDHGMLPDMSYKAWLDTVSKSSPSGRVYQSPVDPTTGTGKFRAALEERATGDDGKWQAEVLLDLRYACDAVGLAYEDEDALLVMLDNPWQPQFIPGPAVIQVFRLEGHAASETLVFETPDCDCDLYDLGPLYESVDPARVDEAVYQATSRTRLATSVARR